jgi:hypothetical protein
MKFRVGIDFDNTIINYDKLFNQLAIEKGLIKSSIIISKNEIRNRVRNEKNGEILWQKMQAEVYGSRIAEASMNPGVHEFFLECRRRNCKIFVISHKTRYAVQSKIKEDLREAALYWMERNSFFDPKILKFNISDIHFANSKIEKIKCIENYLFPTLLMT